MDESMKDWLILLATAVIGFFLQKSFVRQDEHDKRLSDVEKKQAVQEAHQANIVTQISELKAIMEKLPATVVAMIDPHLLRIEEKIQHLEKKD